MFSCVGPTLGIIVPVEVLRNVPDSACPVDSDSKVEQISLSLSVHHEIPNQVAVIPLARGPSKQTAMVVKVLFIVASPTHGDYGCSLVVKHVVTVAVIAGDDGNAHGDWQ
ncbi:hypothetical protein L2E82_40703 [Cichorium intybus]|uniref:Uncharacterized protein n=1 Tax=Cichorium intybus TaxID=13427 RepID=A0ACB9AM30_CICIN|nr:hypothetical protein L2E82_40703 [Cichorium intybus]